MTKKKKRLSLRLTGNAKVSLGSLDDGFLGFLGILGVDLHSLFLQTINGDLLQFTHDRFLVICVTDTHTYKQYFVNGFDIS